MFRDLSKMSDAQILTVSDRTFIMLSDLDPNTDYYVMVNASSEMRKSALMTRTEMFSLKPRCKYRQTWFTSSLLCNCISFLCVCVPFLAA